MAKILFFIIMSFLIQNAYAFDNLVTHRELTKAAIEHSKSNINDYLINRLELLNGVDSSVEAVSIRKIIWDGSFYEDEPNCRASNHFHNPLRPWDESGMRDEPWFISLACAGGEYPPENISSNIHWATGYIEPSPDGFRLYSGNEWDWDHAREYFYTYLTGKDLSGNIVAISKDEREAYFADSLRALGQVLHLLQDMAVPAHTRDDFKSHLEWNEVTPSTLFKPKEWIIERFEHYVKKNTYLISGVSKPAIPELSLTNFWDADTYSDQNPQDPDEFNSLELGLAEFTNMNFLSKNTIFSEEFLNDSIPSNDVYYHPYPRKTSTNIQDLLDDNLLPKTITSEDGNTDDGIYISKTGDGVPIDNFVRATYFSLEMMDGGIWDERLFFKTFKIDDECAKNYAEILLPRAIGYSSALLDYFFRGKIEITNPILGYDSGTTEIDTVTVSAKNISTIDENEEVIEEMVDGTVQLVLKYKYPTFNPDPELPAFVEKYEVTEIQGLTSIPSDAPIEIEVNLDDPLPSQITELQIFLVFRGKLGNEDGGIAVGFKEVAGILFEEDWDNGLTGNYNWDHATAADNPSNGETINDLQDNVLIKENKRYVGHDTARWNGSILDLKNTEYPDGIPITQNTYIHFKIPEMSINEKPPTEPGYTNDWQYLEFRFNNGRILQLSQGDQFIYENETTAYYSWDPSLIFVDNIYSLFERAPYGITIPEPLYLETIYLDQQLWFLDEPSTVEHIQHMEVDFIRIVGDVEEDE